VLAGNSDPFSSTTIPVTPSVNHLLIFTRDFILPANHGNEAAIFGGKLHMHRYWSDSVRGLGDGGADGFAYVSPVTDPVLVSLLLHGLFQRYSC
jgi:hypothetical protein